MKQGMLQRVRVPVGWTLKDERGVTGLETAIILIAFVVVASVFAFTVLSTGIFSAERGEETVFAGLQEARGTIETKGGVIANALTEDVIENADDVWVAVAGTTVTATTTAKKEGTAAAALVIPTATSTGIVAYEDMAAAVDLTNQTQLSFWIKSSATLTAGQLEIVLDEGTTCSTIGDAEAQVDVPALTADTWAFVTAAITDGSDVAVANGDRDAIQCVGLNAASDVTAASDTTIVIDDIRAGGLVTTVQMGITNAVEGEPINLFQPSDADADGIADTDSRHVLVITYTDNNQLVRDLNWTASFLGDNDFDDLLEAGERAEITIELDGLADGTPLVKDQEFTLEIKPAIGAVMVIKRRTPSIIDAVMNLN